MRGRPRVTPLVAVSRSLWKLTRRVVVWWGSPVVGVRGDAAGHDALGGASRAKRGRQRHVRRGSSLCLCVRHMCVTARAWGLSRSFLISLVLVGPIGMAYVFWRYRHSKPARLAALLGFATQCLVVGVMLFTVFGAPRHGAGETRAVWGFTHAGVVRVPGVYDIVNTDCSYCGKFIAESCCLVFVWAVAASVFHHRYRVRTTPDDGAPRCVGRYPT